MEPVPTERLLIRRPTTADLRDFLAYRNHSESLKLMPIAPMTEDAAANFLSRQATLDLNSTDGWIMFALGLKDGGRMIGEIGLFVSPSPHSKSDLGWSIHPEWQGRGYATEAAPFLLTYAFGQRKLHRVTSGCDARNTASFRVMERLGLRREGHFRQSHFADGSWHGEYQYALLREEWLVRTAP